MQGFLGWPLQCFSLAFGTSGSLAGCPSDEDNSALGSNPEEEDLDDSVLTSPIDLVRHLLMAWSYTGVDRGEYSSPLLSGSLRLLGGGEFLEAVATSLVSQTVPSPK